MELKIKKTEQLDAVERAQLEGMRGLRQRFFTELARSQLSGEMKSSVLLTVLVEQLKLAHGCSHAQVMDLIVAALNSVQDEAGLL